jgi:5,10-methylenetetrahydromethanopterin reductase
MHRQIAVTGEYPWRSLLEVASEAEELGFEVLWFTDQRFWRDSPTMLGALGAATKRIGLAPGVSDPFSRHPASVAVAAATLNEIAPGRSIIGLGAGGGGLAAIGVEPHSPVRTLELAVAAIRDVVAGHAVSVEAPGFKMANYQLKFKVDRPIPIAIVAHGPRMYELAGRVADIAFVAYYTTPAGITWIRDRLAAGIAGRDPGLGPCQEVWRVDVCIAEDAVQARNTMKQRLKRLVESGSYNRAFLEPVGLGGIATGELALNEPNMERLLDAVAIAGTRRQVTAQIRDAVHAYGFDTICCRLCPTEGQSLLDALHEVDRALRDAEPILAARAG